MKQRLPVWAAATVVVFLAAVGYGIGNDAAADRHRQSSCYSHAYAAAGYALELRRVTLTPAVVTADLRYELKVLAEGYSRWEGIGYARNGPDKSAAERAWNEATTAIRIAADNDTPATEVSDWLTTAKNHTAAAVGHLRWSACR